MTDPNETPRCWESVYSQLRPLSMDLHDLPGHNGRHPDPAQSGRDEEDTHVYEWGCKAQTLKFLNNQQWVRVPVERGLGKL